MIVTRRRKHSLRHCTNRQKYTTFMPAVCKIQKNKNAGEVKEEILNPTQVNWWQSSRRPRNDEARNPTKPGRGGTKHKTTCSGREPKREKKRDEAQLYEVRRYTEAGRGADPLEVTFCSRGQSWKTMRPETIGRVRQQVSHHCVPNEVLTTQRASSRPVGETIAESEAQKRVRVTRH